MLHDLWPPVCFGSVFGDEVLLCNPCVPMHKPPASISRSPWNYKHVPPMPALLSLFSIQSRQISAPCGPCSNTVDSVLLTAALSLWRTTAKAL